EEARILDGGRADDDIGQAAVQVGFDGVQVADAAADLHGDFTVDGPDDGAYGGFVLGLAGYGAVQVDQVQPAGPLLQPLGRHGCRVLGNDREVVEVALAQAYGLSVLEIDGRHEKHGGRISTEVGRYRFVGGRSDQGFQPTNLRYS